MLLVLLLQQDVVVVKRLLKQKLFNQNFSIFSILGVRMSRGGLQIFCLFV